MTVTAARLQVEIGSDTSDAEKGVSGFGDKLNNMSKSLAKTGGVLSAAFTAPLLGIGVAAVSSASEFQQNMNILQQVTGASTEQMAAMQAQALDLGAKTVFSAGEAADAMLELGKAGMSTSDIMDSISGVLDLAAAGGIGLAQAANLTANALNAFHLKASEATRVANIFAATANASSADITDLGAGMQAAGFAFANANQPIENLAASLAILTNVGLTGSDAGTALKNAFMRMVNPTAEAAAVMKQLGISFYDANGQMKALPDIIDMLNTATAGLTDQQRDAALATIFMSDGMKAMLPLMDQGSAGFNRMVDAVSKQGAASEVANARMRGLAGAIEYFKGSLDSFLIGTALPFLDSLSGMTRAAADAITAFGNLPQPIINATLAFLGVLAAAGPLMLAISGVISLLGAINPVIGIVVLAVAGLAAAWASDFGGIQEVTAQVFSAVQSWFTSTVTVAQQVAGGIQAAFTNTKFPTLQQLWSQFKAGDFATIAEEIKSTTYTLMVNLDTQLHITATANDLKNKLVDAVNSLGTAVSNLDFSGAKTRLEGVRDGILNGLANTVNGVNWAQGGKTFAGLISGLTAAVNGLDFSGIDWATTLRTALVAPAAAAMAALQWVIGADSFANLKTSVQGAIQTIDWSGISINLGELASAVGTQIGSALSGVASTIATSFAQINWGGFHFGFDGMIASLTNAINGVDWTALGANTANTLVSALEGAFAGIWGAADFVKNLSTGAAAMAANLAHSIADALHNLKLSDALVGLGTAIDKAIRGFVSGFAEAFGAQGAALREKIGGALQTAMAGLSTTITTAWNNLQLNIPALDWATIVSPLRWADFIAGIEWTGYIKDLTWDSFVSALSWGGFITNLSWTSFVNNLSWSNFVPDIDWSSFVPDFSWGDWIKPVNWFNFIPHIPGFAGGTDSAPGGAAIVGERGPELVVLPRGAQVYNHQQMAAMASGVTVQFTGPISIASEWDVEKLTNEIAKRLGRKMR